ncbi:hypothetical protein ACNF49_40740 [Actinomadura sp. ATCC 39365]
MGRVAVSAADCLSLLERDCTVLVEVLGTERIRALRRMAAGQAELRRQAVRMVTEVRPDYSTEWATINAVATKLGIGTPETLRT